MWGTKKVPSSAHLEDQEHRVAHAHNNRQDEGRSRWERASVGAENDGAEEGCQRERGDQNQIDAGAARIELLRTVAARTYNNGDTHH